MAFIYLPDSWRLEQIKKDNKYHSKKIVNK